jgi:hypothetical protein
LVISFLNSKEAFKKCFHNVFLFCPSNSRQSIKDDFWDKNLEPERIYDDLDIDMNRNELPAYGKLRYEYEYLSNLSNLINSI